MDDAASYSFGNWRLVPARRELRAGDEPVRLGGRAFDMLVALVVRRERIVSKPELLDLVWPRLVVEENNLQVQIAALRKLLGHPAIATVPGRGYRFVLPVVEHGTAPTSPPPPPPTHASLIGRDGDLRTLAGLVEGHALVTLAGAGGIGKTRLAQSLVQQQGGGACWVELAPLADPRRIAEAVAQALGLPEGAGGDPQPAVVDALRGRHLLLVLDNAEHLLQGVVAFVAAVRERAPGVRMLVTSQEVLRVDGEQVFRPGPLSLPEGDDLPAVAASGAAGLFAARARAADRHFTLHAGNAAAVAEICRRLDGIPLAIELAAARLPLLGLEGLRLRLDECFRILTAGSRAALPRHQTLRAALDWSHRLLSAEERKVFRRLGVFVGGFTLQAAQAVAEDEAIDTWDALEHLGALVDKSLVVAEGDAEPRCRLLETTRLFALEQLAAAGETAPLLQRHAQATAEQLAQVMRRSGPHRTTGDDRRLLQAEIGNTRAALQWAATDGDPELRLQLAGRAAAVFVAIGRLDEGFDHLQRATAAIGPHVPPARAAGLWTVLARLGADQGGPAAIDAAQRALALYRELGDDAGRFEALLVLLVAGARPGAGLPLQALHAEAAAIEQPSFPAELRANFQGAQGAVHQHHGRAADALACYERMALLLRDSGFPPNEHLVLGSWAADCEIALGRIAAAEARARAAAAALQGDPACQPAWRQVALTHAHALVRLGRHEEARDLARTLAQRFTDPVQRSHLATVLAFMLLQQRAPTEAALLAGFARHALRGFSPVAHLAMQALRADLDAGLAAAWTPAEREARLEAGARLGEAEAWALALAA